MAHNYLEVDISRLSDDLKLSCALLGNVSSDGNRLITAGYVTGQDGQFALKDNKRVLAHTEKRLSLWSEMLTVESISLSELISSATEKTKKELFLMYRDIENIWYEPKDNSENG